MKKLICLVLAALMLLSCVSAFAAEYKDKATVKKVQQALNDAGYNCGTPDGSAGKKTKAAITDYQNANGLEATGVIDDALLEALGLDQEASEEAAASEAPEAEAEAPAELPHINFRGAELGATFAEIKDTLEVPYVHDEPEHFSITLDDITAGNDAWTEYDKAIYTRFATAEAMKLDVAGNECWTCTWYFVKPITDGVVSDNEDDYVFYGARYQFLFDDVDGAKKDLTEKLTQLYGEPEKRDMTYTLWQQFKTKVLVWKGENDVEVVMKDNRDNDGLGVFLSYLWRGAQPMIDEALALPVPEVDNSGNMSGL